MRSAAYSVGVLVAVCGLSLAAAPTTMADPTVTLPPMSSTGGGSVIGGGSSPGMSQKLTSLANPNVQEVDGSDAEQFIIAAAGVANPQLAAPFGLLKRALSCQAGGAVPGAGFAARAYRRNDGQWGGAMLVAAKSATPDVDALTSCAKTTWRRASAGSDTSMCDSGWTTPNSFTSRAGAEAYYILIAGTADDFCAALNATYKSDARSWPF
jgi:hypothetical protein